MLARRWFSSCRFQMAKAGTNTKHITPQEFVAQKQQHAVEQEEFKNSLLAGDFTYKPQMVSQDLEDPKTNRPIPINVELLKFKPVRLDKTHGHEVASLKFRGYKEDDLILSSEFASRAAFYLGIPVGGIIKKKTEKRLYTVIRSPFAQAKSKENFWRTTYNYQLKAYDATPEIVDLWLSYINKYALEGVQYSANLFTREGLDFTKQLDVGLDQINIPLSYKNSDNVVMDKVEELLQSQEFQKYFK